MTTDVEFSELRYAGRPAAFLRGFRALYLGIPINCIIIGWVNLAMLKILQVTLGLDASAAGQVVAGRPERPPPLDPLPLLERGLVLGGPLVVDQVPWHREERLCVGRSLLDDDLQADQPRPLPQILVPDADLLGRLVLRRQEAIEEPKASLRQLIRRLPGWWTRPRLIQGEDQSL